MKQIIVDSCVWIAAFYKRDKNHDRGKKFLDWFNKHESIKVIITDYIISETLTYLRKKTKNSKSVKEVIDLFLEDERFEIYFTLENFFYNAMEIFKKYEKLSFIDSASVVFYFNLKPDYLLSYDSGFNAFKNIVRFEHPQ